MKASYNLNLDLGRKAAIADYLTTKPRVNSYLVTYRRYFYNDGDCEDYTPEYFKEFSDEQIAIIRELFAQADEIWEYFTFLLDEDTTGKYKFLEQEVDGYGQWFLAPESIDLNTVYHRYAFKIAIFYKGVDAPSTVRDVRFNFSDEEYSVLLDWKIRNPHSGFNFLRVSAPELYKMLCDRFDNCFTSGDHPPFYTPTYAVEMTKIEADAKMIIEKYGNN